MDEYGELSLYGSVPKKNLLLEEYKSAEYDIGNMALIFEGSYERSRGDKVYMLRRVKAAYGWGIYFGLLSEQEAVENLREKFGADRDDVDI